MSTSTPLRWGILGAGSIANRFTSDVGTLPAENHSVVAVGSRDQGKADDFAKKHGIARAHASYDALVSDPDVDVIYVATPHNFHREHSSLALRAGKHVLCEKPFTINRAEAQATIDVARETGRFLMEGMWSRFFPAWAKVRALIADGAIGTPRMLLAEFGFKGGSTGADGKLSGVNPQARLYNPDLGGGALMDVGVYPISLAQMLLGDPDQVAAVATVGHTGVDENTGMLLRFPSGAVAVTSTSLQVNTPQAATLLGTDGKIEVPSPWWCPKKVIVTRGGESEVFEWTHAGSGFEYEAEHVRECLAAGKTQSEILSWDDSLAVMDTLDKLRAAIGVAYPME